MSCDVLFKFYKKALIRELVLFCGIHFYVVFVVDVGIIVVDNILFWTQAQSSINN